MARLRPGLRGFHTAVVLYCVACMFVAAVIVVRGDGPHPRVVGVYPANGDQYWPGGTVQITFSQPMNQSSVERALVVSPGAQGQGAWFDNTLNLQPLGDWKPNTTYRLTLRGAVLDELGRPLRTAVHLQFRVHHVGKIAFCRVHRVRNVCEVLGRRMRPLTWSPVSVSTFALSGDGSMLAYIRRDASNQTHLFVIGVDGTLEKQLTAGHSYSDSAPTWLPGDSSTITYQRRPTKHGKSVGPVQTWNVHVDGSANYRLT